MVKKIIYSSNHKLQNEYENNLDKTINIKVLNTFNGTLYMDEYWSGDHENSGSVIVPDKTVLAPDGVTLHIADNSNITFYGDPDSIFENGLDIMGTLNCGDGASFTIHPDVTRGMWRGIFVEGSANIGESEISKAVRALTVTKDSVINLNKTSIRSNNIGIHSIGLSLYLNELSFYNNFEYAIKEDSGAEPVVTRCWFENNLYDYYNTALTAIDFNKLNELGNNNNNRGNN